MDELALALGPAFVAGFAVQRLLELADPVLDGWAPVKDRKKIVLGAVSLVFGLSLAWFLPLSVLRPLGVDGSRYVDVVVSALVLSAGTEGLNSIMKFLGYAKEDKKAAAADSRDKASEVAVQNLTRAV
jgi:hypothetical protein